MQSSYVIFVTLLFFAVALIFGSYSQSALAKAIAISGITCQTNLGLSLKVECCQSFRDGKIETLWCTQCDNTVPPSNCGPRYSVREGSTGFAGNALPPSSNNNTGTLPPGSIIKVPPGVTNAFPGNISNGTAGKTSIFSPIRNATISQPTSNNTGTVQPPPTLLAKQPSGHHHKGSNVGQNGGSTSNGNSTGH